MKKPILLGVMALTLSTFSNAEAVEYKQFAAWLIQSGVTDLDTVTHNSRFYLAQIKTIRRHAKSKKIATPLKSELVLADLTDLQTRAGSQIGELMRPVAEAAAPEVFNALAQAKIAWTNGNQVQFHSLLNQAELHLRSVLTLKN